MAEIAPDIRRWIEEMTGGRFVSSRQVAAGGRIGHIVDVERGGEMLPLFIQLGRLEELSRIAFLDSAREAEIYRALAGSGIPIPKVWGASAEHQAFLVDRVKGVTWMHPPATPEEQLSVAQDFIRHLATWHKLDPDKLDLPSFKPVLSAREHQKRVVADMRAQATAQGGDAIEPMLRISLDFLERELPDYEGPTVLLQGDTGPGNFMYENGKVSGVIDWELAHLGDPMDDIAWVTWRATQHTFTHVPDRLREYEALTGFKIDDKRVYYYRVNACVRLASSGSGPWGGFGLPGMGVKAPRAGASAPVTSDSDRGADGSAFVFTILHRRMRLEALMTALGLPISGPQMLEEAPAKEYAQMYEDILARLQVAVKRTEDRTAANLMKGIARSVKYLKEADRNGAKFDQLELEDIGEMMGRKSADITEARQGLYAAAVERKISDEAYILYHWRRMLRDEQIMRVTAGSVYGRGWPPLH
jgi:aminoglycoside phosphotransferase